MKQSIIIKAGHRIYDKIKQGGFSMDDVSYLAGASGSAKFLILTSIDKVLVNLFANREKPVHMIGTSIGAFRMAGFCQPNPQQALDKLQYHYIHQSYRDKPTKQEVSKQSYKILDAFINDDDIDLMLTHPSMKLNFLTNRCRGLLKYESTPLQAIGLLMAAGSNYFNRHWLKFYFERALFAVDVESSPYQQLGQFPQQNYQLTKESFKLALLACGSIPIVMKGIDNIAGVPGMHRDGGIIDYHLDIPFGRQDEEDIVLYPHFYPDITPGWFDKQLKRKPSAEHTANMLLVAPSADFVNTLPYQKIPDRKDFYAFNNDDKARINYWNKVTEQNKIMGDQFFDAIDSGSIKDIIQPFEH